MARVVLSEAELPLIKGWGVVAEDHTPHSHTGDLVETVLASFTLPGGSMGPNGALRITTLWSMNNNANSKLMRVTLAGNNYTNDFATTQRSYNLMALIWNRDDEASQVGNAGTVVGGIGSGNRVPPTSTVDTADDQDIEFRTLLANAADTCTLESYTIELLHGA